MGNSILGREVSFIFIAAPSFKGDRRYGDEIISLSSKISLEYSDSRISINAMQGEEVKNLSRQKFPPYPTYAIKLSINIDRNVVESYKKRSINVISDFAQEKNIKSENILNRSGNGGSRVMAVTFNGELHRDFQRVSYLVLTAAHIGATGSFYASEIASIGLSGTTTYDKYSISLFNREAYIEELGLRRLPIDQVYNFIWNSRAEIHSRPISQFMKGLCLLSQIYSDGENPLSSFVWSISAIEAMLCRKNENCNIRMIEDRIRAIYDGPDVEGMIGKFRKIYRYRNDLMHGIVDVPFSFDTRMEPFNGVQSWRNTMPYDSSVFLQLLAIKILQRFFELNLYNLNYSVSLSR